MDYFADNSRSDLKTTKGASSVNDPFVISRKERKCSFPQ